MIVLAREFSAGLVNGG